MKQNDLTHIARVLDIAKQISTCDFRVVTAMYADDETRLLVICVGETFWSRCLTVADADSDDPTIQLLVDDGCGLWSKADVEVELPLSEFVADGHVSVRQNLEPDRHRNARLA